MYFWKIKELREHLIRQGLSQRALFIYIFIYVVASGALLELTGLFPSETETATHHYVWALINTALYAVGIYLCYYFNGGAAGREFAERYFSISLVVTLRLLALILLIAPVLGLLAVLPESEDPLQEEVWLYIVSFLVMAGYYWRVITHINIVARLRKS